MPADFGGATDAEMAEETKDSKADAAEPTEEEKLEALPDMEVATQRFLCGTPDEVGTDGADLT